MNASGHCYEAGAHQLGARVRLPTIMLPSTLGGALDPNTLKGAAVIYVYPWTGRPGVANPPGWDEIPGAHGSTPQAEGFRDHYRAFREAGWDVYGVSGQTAAWQREFSDRLALPFALLSDSTFALANALNLPRFSTGGIAYLNRLTFFVRDGAIIETIYPVLNPAGQAAAVLTRIGAPGLIVKP